MIVHLHHQYQVWRTLDTRHIPVFGVTILYSYSPHIDAKNIVFHTQASQAAHRDLDMKIWHQKMIQLTLNLQTRV